MAHLGFVGNSVASVTEVTSSFDSAYQSKLLLSIWQGIWSI